MAHPKQGPLEWRDMVLCFHGPGMTNGARVLLMVMAERMDARRNVSISRVTLARILGVDPRRITERVQIAHELGLLDTVVHGRPGVTAVYQGLFPDKVYAHTKSKRDGAAVRTKPLGAVERTIAEPKHGAHVQPPSSKRNASEPYGFRSPRRGKKTQQQEEPAPACRACTAPLLHPWAVQDGRCFDCKERGAA